MARTERQDEIEYCERCGISFLWSAEEQKREADMPRLCSGCRRLLPQAERVRGAVKWYSPSKHYGFITRRDGDDLFAHRSQVKSSERLRPGDLVEFGIEEGEKGPVAVGIRVLAHADELDEVDVAGT